MAYRFLEPTITAGEGVAVHHVPARPEVYSGTPLHLHQCERLARTILHACEDGQAWESRTRYAPGARSPWGVDRRFRSSRNVSPELPGLDEAFAAMEAEAPKAFPALGLDPARSSLRRIDDQCLVYFTGDHIGDHADNAASAENDDGTVVWHVIKPRRHVVSVMWLTNQTEEGDGALEFAGGELRFNSLVDVETEEPLVVRPAAGKMVVFPASAWFRHEVLAVKAGVRLAVTRWWEVVPNDA